MDPKKRVSIGNTDVEITQLGCGTSALGGLFKSVPYDIAEKTINVCMDYGIHYFDTAPLYGYGFSEILLGSVLNNYPRNSYMVSSKVGRLLLKEGPEEKRDTSILFKGEPIIRREESVKTYFDFSYDGVLKSFEQTQIRTGIDYFEILFIHDPFWYPNEALNGALKALDELKRNKSIGAIGCGMTEWEMLVTFAHESDFDCFLLAGPYTLLDQSAITELLPLCVDKKIAVINGSIYNSGLLCNPHPSNIKKSSEHNGNITNWVGNITYKYKPANQFIISKMIKIKEICDYYSTPVMAAAIQFSLAHPAIMAVLMGPRSPEQAIQNINMFKYDIPIDLWKDLKESNLIHSDTPIFGK